MPAAFNSTKFMSDAFFADAVTAAGLANRHAVIEEGPDPAPGGGLAKVTGRWATITMLVSEWAAPAYGDKVITSDLTEWTVQSVERSGDVWRLKCAGQFRAAKPKS